MTGPPKPRAEVDADIFRRLVARWATGVSVVTASEGDQDAGLTVNALLSISLHPPLLLVSLTHDADTTPIIERTGRFGVSLLSAEQRSLSERFSQAIPSPEKFHGVAFHRGTLGVALLDGALATFECEVDRSVPIADHRLVIGRVVALSPGAEKLPLLFFRSRYGEADDGDSVRLPLAKP